MTHATGRLSKGRLKAAVLAAVAACTVLALAPAAQAQVVGPVLQVTPISVGPDGAITLAVDVGGDAVVDATLLVNGNQVQILDTQLAAQVRVLTAENLLEIRLGDDVFTIPFALLGSGIPGDVLDLLRQAGLTLQIPPGGLTVLDGLPLVIQGRILDRDVLAELKINGVDVLGLLDPITGIFSVPLPGSTKEVTVSVTDTKGVSQTSTFAVSHFASTPFGRVRCTIVGTAGNDHIVGTAARDVICALGGNDLVHAQGGNDVVAGGTGADSLWGQLGRDRISSWAGNDTAVGGGGSDKIWGGGGRDRLLGGSGNDRLAGQSAGDRLRGDSGSDRLIGGGGLDRMNGGTGNDVFFARDRRRDSLAGGAGFDRAHADKKDMKTSIERRF
jgi:Ca2+-binding RTX toxin-like protein